jgi:peroxiredoxin
MMESTPRNTAARSKPSPILLVFLIFPLLGIVAAIALALSESGQTVASASTPLPVTLEITTLIDKAAPNFELTGLDGKTYRLSSYRGRVVFVNFWATWCIPCQTELPTFQQFQAQQGQAGAVILAVNQAEPADKITSYLQEHNISGLDILLDSNLDANTAYDILAMPTTFVVDPKGIVRYKHLGEMKPEDLAAYIGKLQS